MLRIGFKDTADNVTFHLEGKLAGAWVDDLERSWYALTSKDPGKRVVVNLAGVTFVDSEGERLLRWMYEHGAELRNGNVMTRFIVQQIKAGGNGSS